MSDGNTEGPTGSDDRICRICGYGPGNQSECLCESYDYGDDDDAPRVALKLYKATMVIQTVILAEDEQATKQHAFYVFRDVAEASDITTEEITDIKQLPPEWNGDCRPWGESDPEDRTIGQIIATDQTHETH